MQTHGGFGYAVEFHVERDLREVRLLRIAPISENLILGARGCSRRTRARPAAIVRAVGTEHSVVNHTGTGVYSS